MSFHRYGAVAATAVLAVALAPAATAAPGHARTTHGTVRGFATGDFVFLNLLDTKQAHVAQVSVSQSAAGVASGTLQTKDTLKQRLLAKSVSGHNAYGHAAGVSLDLGQPDGSVPQARLTTADAVSPPRSHKTTNLLTVPAAPVATATVQPDKAEANTTSQNNFCVLGKPLSQGTADVADAQLVPADAVAKGFALADVTGEVLDQSTEQLVPNGHGAFGLSSSSTLQTASLTLFKGIPQAETTIKVVNPVTLDAVAGGVPGSASVSFGDANGKTPVLKITSPAGSQLLTLDQLIGKGAIIDFDGLLKVHIGLKPTTTTSADGTTASALADLVKIQVIGNPTASQGSVGGPLGGVLNPVLGPVLQALDQSGVLQQIDQALTSAGLTTGVDFRLGHFEASSQVPTGGIRCGLPVHKTVDTSTVHPGDAFTYTIAVDNPYDCTLEHVRVADRLVATDGVRWHVTSTSPTADTVTNRRVVWNDIGTIKPGATRAVHVAVVIDEDSTSGRFTDHAKATASCGTGGANGGADVTLTGRDVLHAPQVEGRPLPHTGSSPWIAGVGALLIGAGLIARRLLGGRRVRA